MQLRAGHFQVFHPPTRLSSVSWVATNGKKLSGLNRFWPANAIADADRLVGGEHKYLAVADVPFRARAGHVHDAIDRPVEKVVVDQNLQLDLPQEVRLVFVPAIHLRAAALPTIALRIADGHPSDSDLVERLAQRLDLGRLDNGHDQLHAAA